MDPERKAKLGTKWTCYSCGVRFYDLQKPDPLCPKCEADQRESPAFAEQKTKAKKAARKKPAAKAKPKPRKEPKVPTLDDLDEQETEAAVEPEGVGLGLDKIDDEEDPPLVTEEVELG
jgi:hypothetical protein